MTTGIILFAHGSSVDTANDAVRAIAADVVKEGGFPLLETAFLELGRPDLSEAVDRLVSSNVDHIIVIPYFLTLGIHLRRDLPKMVEACARRHPGIRIDVTDPLDGHPALRLIVLDRAQKALECKLTKSHTSPV